MTEYEAFAIELAREAARVTLPFFRSDIGHEDKGGAAGFDPVTEADKQAEAAIRRLIADRYPDHGVIGEEYRELERVVERGKPGTPGGGGAGRTITAIRFVQREHEHEVR